MTALVEACQLDSCWWPAQVKKAIKGCATDPARWNPTTKTAPAASVDSFSGAFICDRCGASFPLRKHLAVHRARRHAVLSPARHFASAEHCCACLRFFHGVSRVQNHLKLSSRCLMRTAHLVRPLSIAEIQAVERQDKELAKRIKQGRWSCTRRPSLLCRFMVRLFRCTLKLLRV